MINTIVLSVFARASNIIARLKEERGQDILEYAVLIGAVALVAAGALLFFDTGETWDPFKDRVQACLAFDTNECAGP